MRLRVAIALFFTLVGAALPLRAQELPPAVVAVIDYQRVLREAAAAQSIRDQIERLRKSYQSEIAREEQRLHSVDKELARQRAELTPEAFSTKRRALEADVGEVQRMVQDRRKELDEASGAALDRVREALIDIVSELADERGFNVVLPASEVLFFARRIDLTEEVLVRLDAKLPRVAVSVATQ